MAGTIDRATLDRLIAFGRQRGELTASELQAALPADALDIDALVLVILELEAAGVSVEPDAFGPRAEGGAAAIRLPIPDPGAPLPTMGSGALGPAAAAPSPSSAGVPAVQGETAGQEEPVGRVILLAGLAVLAEAGDGLVKAMSLVRRRQPSYDTRAFLTRSRARSLPMLAGTLCVPVALISEPARET